MSITRRELIIASATIAFLKEQPANANPAAYLGKLAWSAAKLVGGALVTWYVSDYLDSVSGDDERQARAIAKQLKKDKFSLAPGSGAIFKRGKGRILIGTTIDREKRSCVVYGKLDGQTSDTAMYEGAHGIVWPSLLNKRAKDTRRSIAPEMYPHRIIPTSVANTYFKSDKDPLLFDTLEGGRAGLKWTVENVAGDQSWVTGLLQGRYDPDGFPNRKSVELASRMRFNFRGP